MAQRHRLEGPSGLFHHAEIARVLAGMLVLACAVAYALYRGTLDSVTWTPLLLSMQVAGLAMLLALVVGTGLAVIAGAVGSLPLVVRSVRVGLDGVDPSLIAAARTLGARPARVLFTIVLPLAAPGVIAGGMLAFARALGDYGITQMVAGARIDG